MHSSLHRLAGLLERKRRPVVKGYLVRAQAENSAPRQAGSRDLPSSCLRPRQHRQPGGLVDPGLIWRTNYGLCYTRPARHALGAQPSRGVAIEVKILARHSGEQCSISLWISIVSAVETQQPRRVRAIPKAYANPRRKVWERLVKESDIFGWQLCIESFFSSASPFLWGLVPLRCNSRHQPQQRPSNAAPRRQRRPDNS